MPIPHQIQPSKWQGACGGFKCHRCFVEILRLPLEKMYVLISNRDQTSSLVSGASTTCHILEYLVSTSGIFSRGTLIPFTTAHFLCSGSGKGTSVDRASMLYRGTLRKPAPYPTRVQQDYGPPLGMLLGREASARALSLPRDPEHTRTSLSEAA